MVYPIERLIIPADVAMAMLGPRSKEAKALRRFLRAERIADRQWWPGRHTRWWEEGNE